MLKKKKKRVKYSNVLNPQPLLEVGAIFKESYLLFYETKSHIKKNESKCIFLENKHLFWTI